MTLVVAYGGGGYACSACQLSDGVGAVHVFILPSHAARPCPEFLHKPS